MKVTIAQLNPVIGDIRGNVEKLADTLFSCSAEKPDLVVFSELFITGYPPRDLLERPRFIEQVQEGLESVKRISKDFTDTGIVVGAPVRARSAAGNPLYNTALCIYRGSIVSMHHKSLLPSYDVFDETRYFEPAPAVSAVLFKNTAVGITVCEDAWNVPGLWNRKIYPFDPIAQLAKEGASLIINISASPFEVAKEQTRFQLFQNHARHHRIPVVCVNQVGGNDELIFDGQSMAMDSSGRPQCMCLAFEETVCTIDTECPGAAEEPEQKSDEERIHGALVLGLRDYATKCGFTKSVIGLSGGIDSSVVCALAKEALGSENVLGITMPGPYSSPGSIDDARALAENLGIAFTVIPISPIYSAFLGSLNAHFAQHEKDVTEENIQARVRGTILMSFSNKLGHVLLATGNKSELAVGYCTLYGDMAGGLAVISDVPKTMVYRLARHINRNREIIPGSVLEKPPSAELRPNQKDQDSLPPYDTLDRIVHLYVDEALPVKDILSMDIDAETVEWVVRAIDRNEYKRRQAPPGLKVTGKAFGMGRRMMIAAKYEV